MDETGLAGDHFFRIIRRIKFIIERINSYYRQPQSSNLIKRLNTFQEINAPLPCHIAILKFYRKIQALEEWTFEL